MQCDVPKVTQLPRSRAGSKPKHPSCTVSASLTEALHTGTEALDWQSAGCRAGKSGGYMSQITASWQMTWSGYLQVTWVAP